MPPPNIATAADSRKNRKHVFWYLKCDGIGALEDLCARDSGVSKYDSSLPQVLKVFIAQNQGKALYFYPSQIIRQTTGDKTWPTRG